MARYDIIGKSKIFDTKEQAIESLKNYRYGAGDGARFMARYYDSEGKIASVIGILHDTNGVRNIEIKEEGGSGSAGNTGRQFVVRKTFPFFSEPKYDYFFQGDGVWFEIPSLPANKQMVVLFPNDLYPFQGTPINEDYQGGTMPWYNRYYEYLGSLTGDNGALNSKHNRQIKFGEGGRSGHSTNLEWSLGSSASIDQQVRMYYVYSDTANMLVIRNYTAWQIPSFHITMRGWKGLIIRPTAKKKELKMYDTNMLESIFEKHGGETIEDALALWQYEEQCTPFDDDTYTYTASQHHLNEETAEDAALIVADYRGAFERKDGYSLTVDTTSPGFRIENGKVKCYKPSSLFELMQEASVENVNVAGREYGLQALRKIKYIKDGTVFYFHPRNTALGISTSTVYTHMRFIAHMTNVNHAPWLYSGENAVGKGKLFHGGKVRKHLGRVEYLGVSRRRSYPKGAYDRSNDNKCYFGSFEFLGIQDNNYVFSFSKGVSGDDICIEKIGVSFMGIDGERHYGYVVINSENIPAESVRGYTVSGETLCIKETDGREVNYVPANDYAFTGGLEIEWVSFNEGDENRAYVPVYNTSLETKTRWKLLNVAIRDQIDNGTNTRHKFARKRLNRCRYYKKFKGVLSEIPEYFYTR